MNGEYGSVGTCRDYLHQNLPFDELVALYLVADVMLVTPFVTDESCGKEYVMCRTDLTGDCSASLWCRRELRGLSWSILTTLKG